MKSKKSFYNASLIKSDLTRFWPVWVLIMLYTFIVHPLATLFEINYIKSNVAIAFDIKKYCQEQVIYNMSNSSAVVSIFIIVPIVAVLLFSYMNKTQTSYTLHSLPLKRSTMLFSHMIAAFFMVAIPYTISFALVGIISLANGVGTGVNILLFLLEIYIVIAFYLSVAALVCILGGNSIINFSIYIVANCLVFMAIYLYSSIFSEFALNSNDLSILSNPVLMAITPIYYMANKVSMLDVYSNYYESGYSYYQPFDMNEITKYNLDILGHFALYLIPTAIFIALAIVLYNKRKLETVGESLCFKWSKPIFRTVFTYFAAILLTGFIAAILYSLSNNQSYSCFLATMGIILVICTLLSYIVCDMILDKTFFVWKKLNLPHMAILALFMAILLYVSAQIPNSPCVEKLDNIQNATISYHGNDYVYKGDILDESIIDFERQIISLNNEAIHSYHMDDLYCECDSITFSYTDDEGVIKSRFYYIMPGEESVYLISDFLDNPDTCLLALGLEDIDYEKLDSIDAYYYEGNDGAYRDYDTHGYQRKVDIYNALIKDIKEGNIKPSINYNYTSSAEDDPFYSVSITILEKMENSTYSTYRYINFQFDNQATHLISVLNQF